ncbi:hypothetical protein FOA43_001397 [Brettanomyces nanus]|uniref:Uncharacterized protein n=1 Tax=Eeniella nana TaxID=13502 RepID=A0A875RY72_EENNA|nr:uncharacterized protein FOA43_001397 [Brettanomyces nanus]QPG74076.1 hypothetical protein FOA43_001397 [Brettanomyces nanus]
MSQSPPAPHVRKDTSSFQSNASSVSSMAPSLPRLKIQSRSSLLIGVTDDVDENAEPLLDSGRSLANEKPAVPPRNVSSKMQVDIPEKFGLDRMAGQEFEMVSPVVGRHGFQNLGKFKAGQPEDGISVHTRTLNQLIKKRKSQIYDVLEEHPELKVPSDQYFDQLRADDLNIELLSELKTGNYDNPDQKKVYSLLYESSRLSDEAINEADTQKLDSKAFEETAEKLSLEKNDHLVFDLLKIYAIVGESTPHPLICFFHSKIECLKISLMLALVLKKFVIGSQKFQFLLLRVLESRHPDFVVDRFSSDGMTFSSLEELVGSNQFWYDFISQLEEKNLTDSLIRTCLVYGFYSLIDVMAEIIVKTDSLDAVKVCSDLCRFEREYLIINQDADIYASDQAISKEKNKYQYFTEDLKTKKNKYNDLLNNYKQLNEERFSDETVLKRLTLENKELKEESARKEKELADKLSSFEVIKVNNDKNAEISKMNEDLSKEIARLTSEVNELKLK